MDFVAGDIGAGGARHCVVEICFTGRLGEPFLSFAARRAEKFGLRGWIEADQPEKRVVVYAEGPEALVHAFEVNCALGPIESRVDSWVCSEQACGLLLDASGSPNKIRFGVI